MIGRICLHCQKFKKLKDLVKDPESIEGRRLLCKFCQKSKNIFQLIKRRLELSQLTEDFFASTSRVCKKCNLEKPLNQFRREKHTKFGRAYYCKVCDQKKIPHIVKPKNSTELGIRAIRAVNRIRQDCSKKNIPIDSEYITWETILELFKTTKYCPCCGVKLNYSISRKHNYTPLNNSPSIDRFIPKFGYIKGNVIVICWRCNNLKRDATTQELFMIAEWMNKCKLLVNKNGIK